MSDASCEKDECFGGVGWVRERLVGGVSAANPLIRLLSVRRGGRGWRYQPSLALSLGLAVGKRGECGLPAAREEFHHINNRIRIFASRTTHFVRCWPTFEIMYETAPRMDVAFSRNYVCPLRLRGYTQLLCTRPFLKKKKSYELKSLNITAG